MRLIKSKKSQLPIPGQVGILVGIAVLMLTLGYFWGHSAGGQDSQDLIKGLRNETAGLSSGLDICNSEKNGLQDTLDQKIQEVDEANKQLAVCNNTLKDMQGALRECHQNLTFNYQLFGKVYPLDFDDLSIIITLSLLSLALVVPINFGIKLFKISIELGPYFKAAYNGFVFGWVGTAAVMFFAGYKGWIQLNLVGIIAWSLLVGVIFSIVNVIAYGIKES